MINWRRMLNVRATIVLAFAVLLTSCSDDRVAGGTTEDAGLAIKNLDVAGLAQKGPFVKGSVVTVQGVDCKTMEFTDEVFEGSVINNDGEYVVENVNLSVACALLEVMGYYLNENTDKKSTGEISLHTLKDLSDRKNVNINVFTELEYKRVMNLVTEKKMPFADAKKQAEKEVLTAFDVNAEDDDFAPFEDLDVFEKGKENVALHDVSVMLQADLDATELAERLENIAADIAKDGKWDDRSSVIPASSSSSETKQSSNSAKDTYLNPNIAYGEMTDSRDGHVYKTVKIGEQVWMAQNLNYKTATSYCFNDSTEYCEKYGRLYTWAASVDKSEKECGLGNECNLASGNIRGICPDGWYLPSEDDFETLINAVGGKKGASAKLKSLSGWRDDDGVSGNGTDTFGFSALPVGVGMQGFYGEGYNTHFWGSTECGSASAADKGYSCASIMSLDYDDVDVNLRSYAAKDFKFSVRCIKDDDGTVPVSSSSVIPASSGNLPSSSSSLVNAYLNPDVEYVEMTDPRDGQVYKTVKIGDQVWMAQNLNYDDSVKTPSLKENSWCYNDSSEYCEKYGRLYSWAAAKDVCPTGWHLPSEDELDDLIDSVIRSASVGKSLQTKLWDSGTDAYGFSAIPAGRRDDSGWYTGESAAFWSSTAESKGYAFYMFIFASGNARLGVLSEKYGASVRCIQGEVIADSSSSGKDSLNFDWSIPKENYLNPNIHYDSLVDDRDGQVYKTVGIGSQVWMAQNLNYADSVQTPSLKGLIWCYGNDSAKCEAVGHLYSWSAAIDSVALANDPANPLICGRGKLCEMPTRVQGVCPNGWHLPDTTEWENLFAAVGGRSTASDVLRSSDGWYYNKNGTNAYGFTALPAGYGGDGCSFGGDTSNGFFWTATQTGEDDAYYVLLSVYNEGPRVTSEGKNFGLSVRCVKD